MLQFSVPRLRPVSLSIKPETTAFKTKGSSCTVFFKLFFFPFPSTRRVFFLWGRKTEVPVLKDWSVKESAFFFFLFFALEVLQTFMYKSFYFLKKNKCYPFILRKATLKCISCLSVWKKLVLFSTNILFFIIISGPSFEFYEQMFFFLFLLWYTLPCCP